MTKEEWDRLPPDKRAELTLQQDKIDEQRRQDDLRQAQIDAQNQPPPPPVIVQQPPVGVQQQPVILQQPPLVVQQTGGPVEIPPPPQLPPVKNWTYLGHSTVDFRVDHDSFQVGKAMGLFSGARFEVKGGDIDLYQMTVVFGDGERIQPEIRGHYDERTSSPIIDFPGDRRYIDHIEFAYRSSDSRDARTTVELFGGR
jgi:hypothetical protein